MELKDRREMNPRDTWDLTPIYPDDAAWEADMAGMPEAIRALGGLPGTLGQSAEALADGLEAVMSASQRAERLYAYAFLCKSGDNGDPDSQEMEARCIGMLTELQAATAFVNPEILAIEPERLAQFMESPRLTPYRHMIDDICRARSHTLDAERERMLALLGDAAQTPSNVFDMFESVDMTFEPITGEDGRPAPLTHGAMAVYRVSKNRGVRREAFEKYSHAFERFINTLAATYAGSVKLDGYFAAVRGYESACAAALFVDNVPVSLYDALVASVHGGLGDMRRYLELRRKALKLDQLHMYDLYVPIVDDVEFEMPYDRAKSLVREALKPLGEDYGRLLDRTFSERWIDVYENRGKTTGAFSMGVYGVHPYVLLNYAGTLDDAFTLAHELGHAMHSFHSDAAQDYANHDYSIFVAEVASTVNEVLLTMHLLKTETDPRRRAHILNHFLEGFRTTVFRQTLFAEFERTAHELQQSGAPLTAKKLNEVYRSLNEMYYPGVVLDGYTDAEWARVPHFYRAFYVYQYATGFLSAVTIADRILNHGGAEDYLRFLSTGGSAYPIDELRIAGVDLSRPGAFDAALKVFAESVADMARAMDR